jgi:ParB family transcriptional regulator, chromosome partitioning protein
MSLKTLAERNDRAMAVADRAEPPKAPEKAVRPITGPGAAAMMRPTFDALERRAVVAEAEVERMKQASEQPFMVRLDQLVSVPGRRRKLTDEQFSNLRENLRSNPLVTPIVVKRLDDGKFEIISGDNRTDVYRSLGRDEIEATLSNLSYDEITMARAAFHANLLQPELPDFEKYLGFRAELDRSKLSRGEVAAAAGISASLLSHLMIFDKLPESAIHLLKSAPSVLGFQAARKLVGITEAGGEAAVVTAIDDLIAGRKTQNDAVRDAALSMRPAKPEEPKARTVKYKQGRSAYCSIRIVGAELRMTFCDDEVRSKLETDLLAVIERHAKAVSS